MNTEFRTGDIVYIPAGGELETGFKLVIRAMAKSLWIKDVHNDGTLSLAKYRVLTKECTSTQMVWVGDSN